MGGPARLILTNTGTPPSTPACLETCPIVVSVKVAKHVPTSWYAACKTKGMTKHYEIIDAARLFRRLLRDAGEVDLNKAYQTIARDSDYASSDEPFSWLVLVMQAEFKRRAFDVDPIDR